LLAKPRPTKLCANCHREFHLIFFRRVHVKGEPGESAQGASRLIRSIPALGNAVREDINDQIMTLQTSLQSTPLEMTGRRTQISGQIEKLRGMSPTEYAKTLTPEKLDELLAKMTGRGGQYEKAVETALGTQKGKEAEIGKEFETLLEGARQIDANGPQTGAR
jgi:hypothetical protein